MKASSSEACWAVSSSRVIPARAGEPADLVGGQPGHGQRAVPVVRDRRRRAASGAGRPGARRVGACGPAPRLRGPGPTNSAMPVSAISRPRPMTIEVLGGQRHLVHQVRGDEDRPALGGEALQQRADPADALGVEAVHAARRGSPLRGRPAAPSAMPSRWPMPSENRPARRRATAAEADRLDHLVHPRAADPAGAGPAPAGGCTRCGRGGPSAPPAARRPRAAARRAPGRACR